MGNSLFTHHDDCGVLFDLSDEESSGEEYQEFSLNLGTDPINFWNGTFFEGNSATFRLYKKDINEECDDI